MYLKSNSYKREYHIIDDYDFKVSIVVHHRYSHSFYINDFREVLL